MALADDGRRAFLAPCFATHSTRKRARVVLARSPIRDALNASDGALGDGTTAAAGFVDAARKVCGSQQHERGRPRQSHLGVAGYLHLPHLPSCPDLLRIRL